MDFRSIIREEHEDARQVARDIAKTKQYDFYFANVRHSDFAVDSQDSYNESYVK